MLSYLLTGVTATGDDGHTAHFHDCNKTIPVSISGSKKGDLYKKVQIMQSSNSNAHFIVKVPVSGKVDGVVVVVLSVEST